MIGKSYLFVSLKHVTMTSLIISQSETTIARSNVLGVRKPGNRIICTWWLEKSFTLIGWHCLVWFVASCIFENSGINHGLGCDFEKVGKFETVSKVGPQFAHLPKTVSNFPTGGQIRDRYLRRSPICPLFQKNTRIRDYPEHEIL